MSYNHIYRKQCNYGTEELCISNHSIFMRMMEERFKYEKLWDNNLDGITTYTNVSYALKNILLSSGDFFIFMVASNSTLASFFEMSYQSYGNWLSSTISVIFALFVMVIIWGFYLSR